MAKERRLTGSYCPLCGEVDLLLVVRDNKEFAQCPPGPLSEAHTVIVVRETIPAPSMKAEPVGAGTKPPKGGGEGEQ